MRATCQIPTNPSYSTPAADRYAGVGGRGASEVRQNQERETRWPRTPASGKRHKNCEAPDDGNVNDSARVFTIKDPAFYENEKSTQKWQWRAD